MKHIKFFSNIYFRSTLLLLCGFFAGWLFFHQPKTETAKDSVSEAEKKIIWTCAMHPQIRMEQTGLCPICGMDLILLNQFSGKADENVVVIAEEAVKLADVQTITVSKTQPIKEIRLYGKIQTDERLIQTLTAHVPGRIEKLFVNFTGETVQKGQTVASIYSPELITAQQELLEAMKIKAVQPQIFDAAEEKLRQFKLTDRQIEDIEKSGKIKSFFDVKAVVSGVVTAKKVNYGDYIQTGTPLFEVSGLEKVWALFDAYENDLPWIKTGDEVLFTLSAVPGKKFSGTVSFIAPVIEPLTRTAKIRIEVDNASGILKPEMLANGTLKTKLQENRNDIIIPESAVLWTGTRSLVYVKLPGAAGPTFAMREVTLGSYLQNSYMVLEGLQEGEEIVTNGTFSIDAAAQLDGKPSMMNYVDENNNQTHNSTHAGKFKKNKFSFMVYGNCELCKARIEKAAKSITGVKTAEWNKDTKILEYISNGNTPLTAQISDAVAAAGHDTQYKKADTAYEKLPDCCKFRKKK